MTRISFKRHRFPSDIIQNTPDAYGDPNVPRQQAKMLKRAGKTAGPDFGDNRVPGGDKGSGVA